MASSVLVGLMIASLWVVPATTWKLRNWRAVVFVAGASAAIVVAGTLPMSVAPFVQAGIWGATLWILLLHADRFPAMAPAELEFVDRYLDIVRRVELLHKRADTLDPVAHVSEFQDITESLERLPAPTDEWAQVRDDAAHEFRRRLTMMRLTTNPPPTALSRVRENWSDVEERFHRLLKERAGFWAGWPRRRGR
jgi:hypothetical protein